MLNWEAFICVAVEKVRTYFPGYVSALCNRDLLLINRGCAFLVGGNYAHNK